MQNHTQQHKTTQNHMEPCQTMQNLVKPLITTIGNIWDHFKPYFKDFKKTSKKPLGKKKKKKKEEEDESSIKSRLNKRQALEATNKSNRLPCYYQCNLVKLTLMEISFFISTVCLRTQM